MFLPHEATDGMESDMSALPSVTTVRCDKQFHVSCEAGTENNFSVGTESVSVRVGQCIRRGASEEIWDSVGVYAGEDGDGNLIVRVLVFNPDWDEPLQIATIRSRPRDEACSTPLGCNLDHFTPKAG